MELNVIETEAHDTLEGAQLIENEFHEVDMEEAQYENVVYSDGTILLHNGQYFIPADGEALVLQDGEENYGSFVISEEAEDSQSSNESQKKVIQYIQENEQGEPVVYELSDDNTIQLLQSHGLMAQDEGPEDDSSGMELLIDEPALKRIKLELPEGQEEEIEEEGAETENSLHLQLLNCDDNNILIDNEGLNTEDTGDKKYQYAVLKNNKLLLRTLESDPLQSLDEICESNRVNDGVTDDQLEEELAAFEESLQFQPEQEEGVDLMRITGKNLLTGQVVTLDNYFDKVYNASKKNELERSFLNSCAPKLRSRKFVTKIISIQKPNEEIELVNDFSTEKEDSSLLEDSVENSLNLQEIADVDQEDLSNLEQTELANIKNYDIAEFELNNTIDETNTSIFPDAEIIDSLVMPDEYFIISEENQGFIKRTLEGLMQMESVQKKIANKYLQVKLVERRYISSCNNFKKSVFYAFGTMTSESLNAEELRWIFMLDATDTLNENNGEIDKVGEKIRDVYGYEEMTSLTLINTISKMGTSNLRVKLNQIIKAPVCKFCNLYFKRPNDLRRHYLVVHANALACQYCDEPVFCKHRKVDRCSVCNKKFSSASSLRRHMTMHDKTLRVLECSVCSSRFPNEYSLKKHLMIHTGVRPFSCDKCHKSFVYQIDLNFHKRIHESAKLVCKTCGREFSRYSNLVRHEEIHKGEGALYKCEICGCSYNYVSSLTRHMVQYHIKEKLSDNE